MTALFNVIFLFNLLIQICNIEPYHTEESNIESNTNPYRQRYPLTLPDNVTTTTAIGIEINALDQETRGRGNVVQVNKIMKMQLLEPFQENLEIL